MSGRPRSKAIFSGRSSGAVLGNPTTRVKVGQILLVGLLVVAGVKLVNVQLISASSYAAQSERQRTTKVTYPATRGAIVDRDGTRLAFSVEVDALSILPQLTKKQHDAAITKKVKGTAPFDQYVQDIAAYMKQLMGDAVDQNDLLTKLNSGKTFVYLNESVDPSIAKQIHAKFPEVAVEQRAKREYPNGYVASNVVGVANWRKDASNPAVHGLAGLESSLDNQLSGTAGSELVDTESGNNSVQIPGTERDYVAPKNGDNVQLTIDSDVQYQAQQLLDAYVKKTGAKDGSLTVLDAKTGEVYALANSNSFDPNNMSNVTPAQLGNNAVTTPYEPGSVNKVITALGAIENNVTTANGSILVPDSIKVADRVIHDDWTHGNQTFTIPGIFAKSSNVGTLELAEKIGPAKWYAIAKAMGLGQKTGIGLPGESAGSLLPLNQWSGSTFGNVPIGQGVSMTVVQMASMYQALANGGLRVPPRIIKSTTDANGTTMQTPQPAGTQVVDAKTAQTVLKMFSYVTQNAPSPNKGTAVSAGLPGYQIAGKTGTAQQIDPNTGTYSDSLHWVTFAGVLPADNPRFVIGVELNAPADHAEGGQTAAPLFHDLANYLVQKYHIPVSTSQTPYQAFVLS